MTAMLAEDLDLTHINVGDIFRWNVQSHTKMGAQVRRTMAAGELVGDDLAEMVTADRLTGHDWNYGFVIDGFPRNARQAEFFLESYDIDSVIHLELPDSEVRRRVLARRLCSGCGMDFHPNLIQGSPCCRGQVRRLRPLCWSPGKTTPRRRWRSGCGSTTRRPIRCSHCSAQGSTSSSSNATADKERSSN